MPESVPRPGASDATRCLPTDYHDAGVRSDTHQDGVGKTGTNRVLVGGGFHHVAVRVADFDGAVHFSTEVLGFSPTVSWGEGDKRTVMLDTGNSSYLEVFAGGTTPSTTEGPILHYAIRAHDVDAMVENAPAHGATVTVEPKDVTIQSTPFAVPVRNAFFRGPAGASIELFRNERT